MISVEKFNLLELGHAIVHESEIKEGRIKKEVKIDLIDYDLDRYLRAVKYTLPKGFKWVKNLIYLIPLRKNRWDDKRYQIAVKYKHPVEFCLKDYKEYGTFRLFPMLPRYAVNEDGKLYDIVNNKFITPVIKKNYSPYPIVNIASPEIAMHRIVAYTWVDNDDYVKKYIVDHIDENKQNYMASNLQWVESVRNTARSSYVYDKPVEKRWIVKDLSTGVNLYFDSYGELGRYFKVDWRLLETRKAPYVLNIGNKQYIVEDRLNFTNWSLLNKIHELGYNYKIINLETNDVKYFKSVEDIYRYFNTTEYRVKHGYRGKALDALKEFLKDKNYEIVHLGNKIIYNQFSKDKYWIEAKDLDTGEIIREPSTRKMAERLGVSAKSMIIVRLNGNKREGIPLEVNGKRYLIRRSDMPFPELRESKKPKTKPLVIKHNGKEYTFKSLRQAESILNVSRDYLRRNSVEEDDRLVIDDINIIKKFEKELEAINWC